MLFSSVPNNAVFYNIHLQEQHVIIYWYAYAKMFLNNTNIFEYHNAVG